MTRALLLSQLTAASATSAAAATHPTSSALVSCHDFQPFACAARRSSMFSIFICRAPG
jgi:hypothetical protein